MRMPFIVKMLMTVAIIIFCVQVGRRFPSLGGLIATMPLTSLVVLLWLYVDHRKDPDLLVNYSKGAMFGILPSLLFFAAAFVCLKKGLPFPAVLGIGFAIRSLGAVVHQWLLR
jgi:F0F1-type ATP synthase assembly protein I